MGVSRDQSHPVEAPNPSSVSFLPTLHALFPTTTTQFVNNDSPITHNDKSVSLYPTLHTLLHQPKGIGLLRGW
jgi:hypothetical protein